MAKGFACTTAACQCACNAALLKRHTPTLSSTPKLKVATLFDDDGIMVRFLNSNVEGNGIRSAADASALLSKVRVGRGLRGVKGGWTLGSPSRTAACLRSRSLMLLMPPQPPPTPPPTPNDNRI
jgi:hypothetical protein